MDRKYDVITLGEILLRLSTPINGRLAQGDTLMKHLGGAELNIASEIGQLGLKTAMISKIPNNLLAAFIKNQMNASRVSENYLISDTADDSRIGVYYYEYGSYPRKPRVVYDRKHTPVPHQWDHLRSWRQRTEICDRMYPQIQRAGNSDLF